jgi:hypothetical protein
MDAAWFKGLPKLSLTSKRHFTEVRVLMCAPPRPVAVRDYVRWTALPPQLWPAAEFVVRAAQGVDVEETPACDVGTCLALLLAQVLEATPVLANPVVGTGVLELALRRTTPKVAAEEAKTAPERL